MCALRPSSSVWHISEAGSFARPDHTRVSGTRSIRTARCSKRRSTPAICLSQSLPAPTVDMPFTTSASIRASRGSSRRELMLDQCLFASKQPFQIAVAYIIGRLFAGSVFDRRIGAEPNEQLDDLPGFLVFARGARVPVDVTARCSAVEPERRHTWFTAAPRRRSVSTAAGLRNRTAWCSGVTPFLSVSWMSAPALSRALMAARCSLGSGFRWQQTRDSSRGFILQFYSTNERPVPISGVGRTASRAIVDEARLVGQIFDMRRQSAASPIAWPRDGCGCARRGYAQPCGSRGIPSFHRPNLGSFT